jgi:hypothetical protein
MQCEWDARYIVFAGLTGSVSGGPGSIYRAVPMSYPPSPGLVCLGVSDIKGTKYIGGWNYENCVFTAQFGIPTWDVPGGELGSNDPTGQPWTTTRVRVSGEVVQVPTGTYKWTSGTDIMPYLPIAEAMAYIGTVNTTANITLGNHTFNTGELLFSGLTSSTSSNTTGERTFEVEYSFLGVSGRTWNQILNREGNWVTINTASDSSGNFPFRYTSFWVSLP